VTSAAGDLGFLVIAEIRNVRQNPGDRFRRWFVDDQIEIFVWYEPDGGIFGFQICCKSSDASLVSTWTRMRGFSHSILDEGEDKPTVNRSPLLRPAPPRNLGLVQRSFAAIADGLPQAEQAFVTAKLAKFDHGD
jgi:hypothetical protein